MELAEVLDEPHAERRWRGGGTPGRGGEGALWFLQWSVLVCFLLGYKIRRVHRPGRFAQALTRPARGAVYAVGGFDLQGDRATTVERYSPTLNAWSAVAPIPTPRPAGMCACA